MTWLKLSKEDRRWLEKLADPLVDSNKEASARRVYRAVDHAASYGDRIAARVLEALGLSGSTDFVTSILKKDIGTIYLKPSGDPVAVEIPSYRGAHTRNAAGEKERTWQTMLWWEMSRVQFEEHIADLQRQSARLGTFAEALLEVKRAWDQHPDCATAGEVCEILGIDPRQFAAS